MDETCRKVLLLQVGGQGGGPRGIADENDHLVEVERVQHVTQLAVLVLFVEFDVVLVETVQRELLVIIDGDLQRLKTKITTCSQHQCRCVCGQI